MPEMNRSVFKSVKVLHNAHLKQYEVYYKSWFFWKFDSALKYDDPDTRISIHPPQLQARERAIERARGMLKTAVVFEETNIYYF